MTTLLSNNKAHQDAYIKLAERRIDSKVAALREAGYRHDTVAFTRGQLEDLEEIIYDVIYGNPREAFTHVPMTARVDPGMTSYSYRMQEKTGAAKVVADGTHDRPMIDTTLSRTLLPIIEVGAAYTYTVGDGESAQILDYDQVQEKARACAEAIALAHNEFALIGGGGLEGGDDLTKSTGFYNDANLTAATGGDVDWTTVTADAAYTQVANVIHQVIEQSSAVHRPTDVLLSTFVWNVCASTRLDTTTGDTVMRALRQNYPDITFSLAPSLTGRGAGGIDRGIFAYEKRADRVEYVASVIYDEAAADKKGFRYTIEARGKAAGTVWRYPLSASYIDITIA
jgi:hypothetical protein